MPAIGLLIIGVLSHSADPKVLTHQPHKLILFSGLSSQHQDLVYAAADRHGLPRRLLAAIAVVESGGRADAINRHTHDYGLMQINWKTAKAWGYRPEQMLDPQLSVIVAAELLVKLRKAYGEQPRWICRYNLGTAHGVTRWKACGAYLKKLRRAGYHETNL